jgi:hypothetical protein
MGRATMSGGVLQGAPNSTLAIDEDADWTGTTAGSSMPNIEVGGNWTADENFDPGSGTVNLTGTNDFDALLSASVEGGTLNFFDLVISGDVAAGTDFVLECPTMLVTQTGDFNVGEAALESGKEELGSQIIVMGTSMTIDGLIEVEMAELCLEIGSVVNVGSTGTLRLNGSTNLPSTICGPPCGNYQVNIAGTLEAVNFEFLDMGPTGIRILDGAQFGAPPFDMRAGVFAEGSPDAGSVQLDLQISQDMDFRDIEFRRSMVDMPFFNVRSSASTGNISFTNFSGDFAGDVWEDDPFDVISWPGERRTVLKSVEAKPGVGRIEIDFHTIREIDAGSMHVLRSLDPNGPFTEVSGPIVADGTETVGSRYSFIDDAVFFPIHYYYRVEEELIFGKRRDLGESDAIPWPIDIGNTAFVGNGGLRTIQEGVDAVPDGGNVMVGAGSYPAFTLTKPVKIMADGSGPVEINTQFSKLIIRDIGAGMPDVGLYGVTVGFANSEGSAGMEVINCDNVVVLDQVNIASGFGFTALRVEDCPSVAIQNCNLSGGTALLATVNSTVVATGGSISNIVLKVLSGVTHVDTGTDPMAILVEAGSSATTYPGSAPNMDFPILWKTNSTQELQVEGSAGDMWILLQGVSKDFLSVTPYMPSELYLLLSLTGLATPDMGVFDTTGTANPEIIVPDMPSLWGLGAPYQILIQRPGDNVFRFGNVREQVFIPN